MNWSEGTTPKLKLWSFDEWANDRLLVFTINHGTNFIIQSHGFHFLSQNLMENVEVNKRIVFTGLDLFRFHRIGSDKADRCLIIMEFCNHIECSRNLDQWVHQL